MIGVRTRALTSLLAISYGHAPGGSRARELEGKNEDHHSIPREKLPQDTNAHPERALRPHKHNSQTILLGFFLFYFDFAELHRITGSKVIFQTS